VTYNTVTGFGPTPLIAQNGIQFGWNATGTIEHNEVSGHVYTLYPTWSSAGILLYQYSNSTLISYNDIHDNQIGIDVYQSSDVTVQYNNIYNNTEYGVYNTPSPIVDARYNWWGDPTGPYHPELNPSGKGDRVSDNVDFEPWLLELYPPATPVETVLYIDPAKVEFWTPSYNKVFEVELKIADVTNLTCYEFKLYWNTTLLDFDYAYIVEIWPLQIKIEDINEAMGRYWLAVSAQGKQSFTGSATLVELYFKVKYDPIYPNNVYSLLDLNETVLGDTSEPTPQPIPHMVHDGEYWCYSTKPKMKVEPSISTAKKLGQTFSVNITVHDVIRMYDFEFWLYYDTTLLDIYSPYVQLGPMMSGATIYISGWDDVLGYVHFAAKLTSPAPPVNGSGTIATVTFKVTKASVWPDPDLQCTLNLINTKLKTIGGIEVPHDEIDGLYRYKPIIGDLNSDGTVDLDDFYIIALAFGSKQGDSNWNKYADLDRNGVVNVLDLRTAARHFGEDC
jgi:parallel beta-helix repeat protein